MNQNRKEGCAQMERPLSYAIRLAQEEAEQLKPGEWFPYVLVAAVVLLITLAGYFAVSKSGRRSAGSGGRGPSAQRLSPKGGPTISPKDAGDTMRFVEGLEKLYQAEHGARDRDKPQ